MNKSTLIKVYLMFFLLFMPAHLSIFFPQLSGNSKTELRKLQDFPELPNSLISAFRWPRRFDQFASDRFPFRSNFIHNVSKSFYKIGLSISQEVIIGENGWLFLRKTSNVLNEHRGTVRLSTTGLNNWVKVFIAKKNEIERLGSNLYLIIIPNKHTIYKNQLPIHHSVVGQNITDQLLNALKEQKVNQIIDLRPTLLMNNSNQRLYDKYNTHWNDKGAYIGYKEIMNRIDPLQDIPRLTLKDISFQKIVRSGDLARLIGNLSLKETTIEAEILNSAILQRQNFENKNKYKIKEWISISKHSRSPVAICFCDSFVNLRLYKFLEQSFSKTIFKHHNSMVYDKKLIEKYKPEYVFYILAERLIPYKLEK